MGYRREVPVLFVIFNVLETAKQVFSVIRQAKPLKLYVVSDGFRPELKDEEYPEK